MKTFKYAWNAFTSGEFEEALNELGKAGWRVIHFEYDGEEGTIYALVEKEIA